MERPPEVPRAEPEILPPGDPANPQWNLPRDREEREEGIHRVYVAKVGPFGFVLMALLFGAIATVVLAFVVGAFLIVIPLAGLLLAAAVISGLWRGTFRRIP